jgi:hypothetical protein
MDAIQLADLRRNLDLLAQECRTDGDKRTLNQRRIAVLQDMFANAVTHLNPEGTGGGPAAAATDGAESAEATGPTEATRPTRPTEPSEPSEPSEASEPSNSRKPAEPAREHETSAATGKDGRPDTAPEPDRAEADVRSQADAGSQSAGSQADAGSEEAEPTSPSEPTGAPAASDRHGSGGEPQPTARINDTVLPAPNPPGWAKAPDPHIVVLVGLDTLLGANQAPGEVAGIGPIPASIARDLATRGTWRCAAVDGHGTILGLGRSTFTPHYRPPAATARFVRLRDQTCVWPGCRRQARHCDLDHRTPHRAGGATCECNLQALCRGHHRLKHEAGFRVRVPEESDAPPGTLDWTTPTGRTVRRHPVPAARPPLPEDPPF